MSNRHHTHLGPQSGLNAPLAGFFTSFVGTFESMLGRR